MGGLWRGLISPCPPCARAEKKRSPQPSTTVVGRAIVAPPSPPKSSQEIARDRIFELLAFDTIDERPENEDPYDMTARLLGRGLPNKAGIYYLPYIQTGHLLMILVLLLSGPPRSHVYMPLELSACRHAHARR